jgi:NADH-quinone oxidoreductase subunit N
LTLTGLALLVLVYDLVKKGRDSRQVGIITLVGLGVVMVQLLGSSSAESQVVLGMVTVDAFGSFFKVFTVGSLMVVTFFILGDKNERRHGIGEYYFLLLGAAIGIFFMVGTTHLLLLMLGLELLSLASYSLAGFHKGDRASAEAALKYVIFGGLSAGIMLYGISLLYGLTGTLDLGEMARGDLLATQLTENPVPVAVAILLVLAGFAFKVSVVPFHFWTPDVYEGAPTPVTTFLAVASKAAGFGALLRFLAALFMADGVREAVIDYGSRIGMLLAIMAAATMTLGNLGALRQKSVKRMLAYSSIAHAGYVLMGIATMSTGGFQAAMFYLAAYYCMNLGAFGFLIYFEGVTGSDTYESLKGMGWKAPLISVSMIVFLVSLTGLPPTVGFFGKYLLFYEAMQGGYAWLAVVAGINSVVSLFYYMRVAKMLFLAEPSEESAAKQPVFTGLIAVLGGLTILFGIYTAPIQDWVRASFG